MPIRDTSRAALLTATKAIGGLRAAIMTELLLSPVTRLELARRLNKPINCISAPVCSLIDEGLIEEFDQKVQSTGRKAYSLRIKEKRCEIPE